MTAVALQQMGQAGQRGKQVKAAIAPGAGLAMLAVQADEKGGKDRLSSTPIAYKYRKGTGTVER